MAARLQRSGEYDIFLKMSPSALDQWWTLRTQVMSSCRLNVRIPLTHRTSRTGHQPGFSQSQGQIQELRVLMWLQMPHGKTHCLSMQPPTSAVCKAQSLGSSLIHTIPASHQRLPGLEDTALLFTRYQPPNSGLLCVEDTLSFT